MLVEYKILKIKYNQLLPEETHFSEDTRIILDIHKL